MLAAMKLLFPQNVFLLRGTVSKGYGIEGGTVSKEYGIDRLLRGYFLIV